MIVRFALAAGLATLAFPAAAQAATPSDPAARCAPPARVPAGKIVHAPPRTDCAASTRYVRVAASDYDADRCIRQQARVPAGKISHFPAIVRCRAESAAFASRD